MKKPTKARQQYNELLAKTYDYLRTYEKGEVPKTGVAAGKLSQELTWVCDKIMEAYSALHPERPKRKIPPS